MICPKCQSELPEGVKFCPSCGANLAEAAQQAVSEVKEEVVSPVADTFSSPVSTDDMPSAAFDPGAPIAIPKQKTEEAVSATVESAQETVAESVAPVENAASEAASVVEEAAPAVEPAFNPFQPQSSEPAAPAADAFAAPAPAPVVEPAPSFQPQQPQVQSSPVVPVVAPVVAPSMPAPSAPSAPSMPGPAPLTPNSVPAPISSFNPAPTNTTVESSGSDVDRKPLSVGGAFWMLLLFAIPVVGLVCSIIFSVSGKKKSRKNLSRAVLLWKVIGIICALILCILLYFLARDAFAAIMAGDINDFIDELSYFMGA